jgi:predicted ArsR family transcriptional regulator
MGFKLRLLNLWTPNFVISRLLDNIDRKTQLAFISVPIPLAIATVDVDSSNVVAGARSVEEKRTAMAKKHVQLVNELVNALGHEKALAMGRESLLKAGRRLGTEARAMLGVGDSPADLIRAAKILYRVLGIDFTVKWTGKESATLVVHRCVLAKEYAELTCRVLSATDEGVMQGLNPNVRMKFREHITGGCSACKADILFIEEMRKQ